MIARTFTLEKLGSYLSGFPHSSVGREYACNAGDPSLIPGWGRPPGEGIGYPLHYSWASLVAQLVKNLPAMLETWVRSLGWEDPLEKGKATHSSIWPGEFHGLYSPWGCKESDMTERATFTFGKDGGKTSQALQFSPGAWP